MDAKDLKTSQTSSCQDVSRSAGPSKQAGICNNQRRSRARRQEYIAGLEQRLRDCHTTCREADLLRSAFVDLQKKNDLLRALLSFAGVTSDNIDSFVRQEDHPNSPQRSEPVASMRKF